VSPQGGSNYGGKNLQRLSVTLKDHLVPFVGSKEFLACYAVGFV
jgi:hypothetical protein